MQDKIGDLDPQELNQLVEFFKLLAEIESGDAEKTK